MTTHSTRACISRKPLQTLRAQTSYLCRMRLRFVAFTPWMYASFLGGVACSLSGIAIVASSEISSDLPDNGPGAALLSHEALLGEGGAHHDQQAEPAAVVAP